MAGEMDPEHPLTLPVSPFGALILALHPFHAGFLPLTLRLPLSRGIPMLPAPDPRVSIALWPGGVIEIELIPERMPAPGRFIAQSGGIRFLYDDAPSPILRCESPAAVHEHPLPPGALAPSLSPLPGGLLFTGSLEEGGEYALILSPDAASALLNASGRNMELLDGGSALRLMHSFSDTVGHAVLETWSASPAGWQLMSSEPMWEHGAPIRPVTPEATALAALEAAQFSLTQEAAAYFAPACPYSDILERAKRYAGCVPLRYALPSGEAAVGLMQLRDNILRIIPARYAAQPGGSGYLLTQLEIDENAQT